MIGRRRQIWAEQAKKIEPAKFAGGAITVPDPVQMLEQAQTPKPRRGRPPKVK